LKGGEKIMTSLKQKRAAKRNIIKARKRAMPNR